MLVSTSHRILCRCAWWKLVLMPAECALAQSAATVALPVAQLPADPAIPAIPTITGHDWDEIRMR